LIKNINFTRKFWFDAAAATLAQELYKKLAGCYSFTVSNSGLRFSYSVHL